MNWILFAVFLILFAENKLKPRIDYTNRKDIIVWYTIKGKRKFWKL